MNLQQRKHINGASSLNNNPDLPEPDPESFRRRAVGVDHAFVGRPLAHYVDPYDINEHDGHKRKMPSAAVS